MKWIIVFAAFCILSIAKPVQIKPVLKDEVNHWQINGKTVAYYQKVTMPDGSMLELKSRTPLTKAQWQKLADDIQKAIENEPKPQICPTCGQEYWP
ncbi:MAG: hypothetical protein HWN68_10055 [Desulfobacterales bacterium]|nr:hypothetical protein [Desulfobacterales bacterium]